MTDPMTGEGVTKDACPECESTDISILPVSSRVSGLTVEQDGTWSRTCNACFAIWGLAKITGKVPFGSSFYSFHHASATVKSLMNYKEDSE